MKDYSGYLICSDFDGTLSFGQINEKNIVAIKDFMKYGGKFTLCTGRRGEDIVRHSLLPFKLNAPMIGLTGSQIYDTQENRVVEAHCLDNSWIELVDELAEKIKYNQVIEIVGNVNVYKFHASNKEEKKGLLKQLCVKPYIRLPAILTIRAMPILCRALKIFAMVDTVQHLTDLRLMR